MPRDMATITNGQPRIQDKSSNFSKLDNLLMKTCGQLSNKYALQINSTWIIM